MSFEKVIVMPSQPEPSPEGITPEAAPSVFSRGSQGDVETQIAYLLFDIRESVRETRKGQQDERTQQLVEGVATIQAAVAGLKEAVDQHRMELKELTASHTKDLNELGMRLEKDINELGRRHDRDIKELEKVAHTLASFGKLGLALVAGGLFAELVRYLTHR